MGYANPIERMGVDAFAAAALDAGVDGVLTVDYPPEEAQAFAERLRASGIDPIFLLAPTSTDERIAAVGKVASGYVYYVSLKGVTGAANLDVSAIASRIPAIKSQVRLPVGVGFGIRDASTARAVAEVADAVVIGSRLVQLLEEVPAQTAASALTSFVADIRHALDAAKGGLTRGASAQAAASNVPALDDRRHPEMPPPKRAPRRVHSINII
jgi:tryptophan synthase alpha chain